MEGVFLTFTHEFKLKFEFRIEENICRLDNAGVNPQKHGDFYASLTAHAKTNPKPNRLLSIY